MSFEKFTDKARKVLVLAQDEARSLHQPYVGAPSISCSASYRRRTVWPPRPSIVST